ncbi:hypothetical protein D0Z70_03985 [Sphingobium terrigena]|uniref:TonB-dependent receptor n=1 Tax=Sphingobium terrigena TaxID=2304063 RepID=A0A418YVS6_9SPHN|nr:TonB-dependent receptor [Sphingobium terrigena]RJG56527.1 hypothetical protein D0Z70_03985 [Sphingobium terrigena]
MKLSIVKPVVSAIAVAVSTGPVLMSLALSPAANAQESAAQARQGDNPNGNAEIIVTGVTRATRKIDSTNTINTITQEDIKRLAPMSTADLLQNVPGIYAEGSTAGEASNNITVRGLPVTGGYRYAPQLIDGLPWYEEPEVQFMNNDVAVRDDLMTDRVEVIKGGTGGILYSNGLGATVNHITRTGKQEFEGGYRLELTEYGLVRNEAFISGPINQNLTFAVGGFYRFSNGIRDVGYTADNGGQIRANLLYKSDDDSLKIFTQAHFINDRTQFNQNVPFQVPRLSAPGTAEDPTKIKSDTIAPIGIDFGNGTVNSPFNRYSTMLGEYGRRQIDMADGIHPNFRIFTFKIDKAFDNGWAVGGGIRHTSGTSDFNAMFTGNDTAYASAFNSARYQNDLVSPAFNAAVSCENGTAAYAKLVGFFNYRTPGSCTPYTGTRENFINSYALARSVGATYLKNGQKVPDGTYLNFLLPFVTRTKARSTSIDLKVSKSFEALGTHDLTVGGYASAYSTEQNFQSSLLVSTMEKDSSLVDLRGLDAAGNPVGPSLTLDGAILPGFFGYVSDVDVNGRAIYALDHWETLGGKLKIDAGIRYQTQSATVTRYDRVVNTNLTPANIVVGSANDTTADNEVSLPGNRRDLSDDFKGFGWSVGANYSFSNTLAVYGLVSRSFRLPSMEDLNEFRVNSAAVGKQVEHIMQYEGGLRYYDRQFDAQLALFYNKFDPRQQINEYRNFTDPSCAVPAPGVPNINACPLVRQLYQRGIKNKGMELSMALRPNAIPGFELRGSLVLQDPKVTDANYTIVNASTNPSGVVTAYNFVEVGENGRRPRRLANMMVNIQPSWDLKPLTGLPVRPYAKFTYFGNRYSESADFNVTLYPAYYHIDAGVMVDVTSRLSAQFHVSNITNQLSFTEGDPIFFDLLGPNGDTNRGVGRPLFGRIVRGSLTYSF